MKVLTYSRVSTAVDKGQHPEAQASVMREFCAARGWVIAEEIIEHGSGGNDKRPGLVKLMALARARKIDVVMVTKMCRLFRSLKHMVGALDEFEALGVKFISIGDQLDMSTPSGRLLVHLLASFSEFERALIRERTVQGLAFAKSRGKVLGRRKIRNDGQIQELRRQGMSFRQIAKLLGISKSSAVNGCTSNVSPKVG